MFSSKEIKDFIKENQTPFIILESGLSSLENNKSYLFSKPITILTFYENDNISSFFESIENYLDQGYWIAGYFAYEFGYFLEPALESLILPINGPYAWLGIWPAPVTSDTAGSLEHPDARPLCEISELVPSISRADYNKNISLIKDYLHRGYTYQINYTFKMNFSFSGNTTDLYLNLRGKQPTAYNALIDTGAAQVLSFSPELFFRKTGQQLITRPMKGTIARGINEEEDRFRANELVSSQKTIAENLMIVDLLRNDLGRVGGNVQVPALFAVEKYPTLFQMTSTITADLKPRTNWHTIFASLFPCGSVTGAPKIKSMEIIAELENETRGVYTGAIGFISPDRDACFNVAIRTVELSAGQGQLGIGGGIVYDSAADLEYAEALLKSSFLTKNTNDFSLIETLLWEAGRSYYLLEHHLARLAASAAFFDYKFDAGTLRLSLEQLAPQFSFAKVRVRIQLGKDGKVSINYTPQEANPEFVRIKISPTVMDRSSTYLYHKTTQREIYDAERIEAAIDGYFDLIYFNELGQLTEGSITNVFIEKSGMLFTPPVSCGLLPGTLRAELLEEGRAQEAVLTLADLNAADKIFVGNSVRGLIKAVL